MKYVLRCTNFIENDFELDCPNKAVAKNNAMFKQYEYIKNIQMINIFDAMNIDIKAKQKTSNRSRTTKLLSNLLEHSSKFTTFGKHWASEVSLNYGTGVNESRVDYMLFEPLGAGYVSDIEKGEFTCYEIKSCKEDVYSGNGLNFEGDKNYIVTTMSCYKDIIHDFQQGKLTKYVNDKYQRNINFGIIVAIPAGRDKYDEFVNPTPFDEQTVWNLETLIGCRPSKRTKSTTELLFCMLRSGR